MAGRLIPHDLVVSGPLADGTHPVEDGLRQIWRRPEVADAFARVRDRLVPPSSEG